jgi:hypothetical protein
MRTGFETESIDRLYLELSQFTKAKTQREIFLELKIREIAESESWEEQSCMAELAMADIENRQPEQFALDYLDKPPPSKGE